jgi:hypothetical protein
MVRPIPSDFLSKWARLGGSSGGLVGNSRRMALFSLVLLPAVYPSPSFPSECLEHALKNCHYISYREICYCMI